MNKKIYNVGLSLDNTVEEHRAFLDKYQEHIDSIYFSLPLGDHFHSRRKISKQFKLNGVVDKFWEILELIKTYDIKLELVLNTYSLVANDIEISASELKRHDIKFIVVIILSFKWSLELASIKRL